MLLGSPLAAVPLQDGRLAAADKLVCNAPGVSALFAAVDDADCDVIELSAGSYSLLGALTISRSVVLQGAGTDATEIALLTPVAGLVVEGVSYPDAPPNVEIRDLSMKRVLPGGSPVTNNGGLLILERVRIHDSISFLPPVGGAVYNRKGNLWIKDSVLENNRSGIGGAVANIPFPEIPDFEFDSGDPFNSDNFENNLNLALESLTSLVEDPEAFFEFVVFALELEADLDADGMVDFATIPADPLFPVVLVTGSSVVGNEGFSFGGGISNILGLVIVAGSSIISDNTAQFPVGALGGGLSNLLGGLVVYDSVVSNNLASASIELTLPFPGFEDGIELGYGSAGGGIYNETGMLMVKHSTISGNRADSATINSNGGGIYSGSKLPLAVAWSILNEVWVVGNRSGNGGGIFLGSAGFLDSGHTIEDSVIAANVVEGFLGSPGGGILIDGGSLDLRRSAILGNEAKSTAKGGKGGGLAFIIPSSGDLLDNALDSSWVLDVENSTFALNRALGPFQAKGGGIYVRSKASRFEPGTDGTLTRHVRIESSTFQQNFAEGKGGHLSIGGSVPGVLGSVEIRHSLFDGGPSDEDCSLRDLEFEVSDNLAESQCGDLEGFILKPSLELEPFFGDHGGPTPTVMPLAASPAIDRLPTGADLGCAVETDQRGVPRPQGNEGGLFRCDAGAVEYGEILLTSMTPARHALDAPRLVQIQADFSQELAAVNADNLVIESRYRGHLPGTYSLQAGGQQAVFDPEVELTAGDRIRITATPDLSTPSELPMGNPQQWSFRVGADQPRRCVGGFLPVNASALIDRADAAEWADVDGDGDLDLAIDGSSAEVFRSDGGTLVSYGAALPAGAEAFAWADVDGDGDPDLAVAGSTSEIYRNDDGFFVAINAGLPSLPRSSVAWGDLDNDGDSDLVLAGTEEGPGASSRVTEIFLNRGNGQFVASPVFLGDLEGYDEGDLALGDLDGDGDLDLVLTGGSSDGVEARSSVYRNEGAAFLLVGPAGLSQLTESSVDLGDADGDGDLDLVLTGRTIVSGDRVAKVFEYLALTVGTIGNFDIRADLGEVSGGEVEWGDYDGDGDLDVLLTGRRSGAGRVTEIHRNEGGFVFTRLDPGLPRTELYAARWGDFDNDRDLDLFIGTGSADVYRQELCLAVDDDYTTSANSPLTVEPLTVAAPGVLGNDRVLGPAVLVVDDVVDHGTLALADDGSFTYTPEPYYNGYDSFTYHFEADGQPSNSATVRITMTPEASPLCRATADGGLFVYTSNDATAIALALAAAAPGGTVKLAGTCAGVTPRGGEAETVYLDQDVTLEGGYSAADWTISDPVGQPTRLDALHLGRVAVVSLNRTVVLRALYLTGGDGGSAGGVIGNSGTLTVDDCLVDDGLAILGGGIFNDAGSLTVVGSTLMNNLAQGTDSVFAQGGAIFSDSGSLSVVDSTLMNNLALVPATAVTARAQGGAIYVAASGAMPEPEVDSTQVLSNQAQDGGAIYVAAAASLSVVDSTLRDNEATDLGGAIANRGTVTVERSLIAFNSAPQGGGISAAGGSVVVENSTVSGNAADFGAGVATVAPATATIASSTIANNAAADAGGGLWGSGAPVVTARNTLLDGHAGAGGNCGGDPITSQGHNLDSDGSCGLAGTDDQSAVDPLLGPLLDHGGTTLTHSIPIDSPAKEGGNDDSAPGSGGLACPATDQRGVLRPQGPLCDIGAFEVLDAEPCYARDEASGTIFPDLAGPPPANPNSAEFVRMAIALAPSGGTVKIAGYCAGVQTIGDPSDDRTQSAHITRDVTLIGGFDGPNFDDDPDPEGFPTTLDASGLGRVIRIEDDLEVTLENLQLVNGTAFDGGGIYNYTPSQGAGSSLTIVDSLIARNVATNSGGGIRFSKGDLTLVRTDLVANESSFSGGGLTATQVVASITDCDFWDNESGFGGGVHVSDFGVDSTLTVQGGRWERNQGVVGGALSLSGTVDATLAGVVFEDNVSGDGAVRALAGDGETGVVTISDSEFLSNSGRGVAVRANAGGAQSLLVEGSLFRENEGGLAVGDRVIAEVDDCRFEANTATRPGDFAGGAISTRADSLILRRSTFVDNVASASGGGLVAFSGPGGADIEVESSTFHDNEADRGGAVAAVTSSLFQRVTVTLTNSTISGNRSVGDPGFAFSGGGGIYVTDRDGTKASVHLVHTTVTANSAVARGGAVMLWRGSATFDNSVLGGNDGGLGADGCGQHMSDPGTLTSNGHNLDSDDTCGLDQPTDKPGLDPLLADLADNGGPTLTHRPEPLSPLIDMGDCAAGTVTEDQIGTPRPQLAGCDIGAVEATLDPTTTTLASSVQPSVFGQEVVLTATVAGPGAVTAGSVTFMDGAALLGTVPVDGAGTAALPVAGLAVGTHSLTATYSGTADLAASVGMLEQVVGLATTTIEIVDAMPEPSFAGNAVDVTFDLTVLTPGAGTPSGSVTVTDGVDNCVVGLPATSCALSLTTVGDRDLIAQYSGDGSFAGSVSDPRGQLVLDPLPPTVTLVDSIADTGDGVLSRFERTAADLTELLVGFSEPMFDPPGDATLGDVTRAASYLLLRGEGPSPGDEGVQSVSCAMGLDPRDTAVPIDAVLYSAAAGIAELQLNGGQPLPSDVYMLLVCGDLTSDRGTFLDGDGDGTGGDDHQLVFEVDQAGPRVARVESLPATADGVLDDGEDTNLGLTDLVVEFDEEVVDLESGGPDDASNPANYLVFETGPDLSFETADCAGGVAASDVEVSVDGADVFESTVVLLPLAGGVPLGEGRYRLLVCGTTSIRDLLGNVLDGDGDGTGGDDHRLDFQIDQTLPSDPVVTSTSHLPGVWSNLPVVDLSWSGAADDGSGVAGYSVVTDGVPSTVPDGTVDVPQTADPHLLSLPPLPEGDFWFHLSTCDRATNCTSTMHFGPLRLDFTPPGPISGLVSPSHSGPASDPTIDVTWTAAADALSGVAGYGVEFSTSATWTCDQVLDVAVPAATSPVLADGSWYAHVCAVDMAGNWGPVVSGGPFVVDTTPPGPPLTLTSTSHTAGVWSNEATVTMEWSGVTDLNGVAGYSVLFDLFRVTLPDTIVEVVHGADPQSFAAARADGSDHWFHLRGCDVAGNCSGGFHAGPFWIDTVDPIPPTSISSSSHAIGVPSAASVIDVEWPPASDDRSGIDGYDVWFASSPATLCPELANLDGDATATSSDPLGDGDWYAHLCAVDAAGNWSRVISNGPYVIETVPPSVDRVATVVDTGDGELTAGEPTSLSLTQLGVIYTEPMFDPVGDDGPDDVSNPDNYLVLGDGGDGGFETGSCADGVAATDVAWPLDQVRYDETTHTAWILLADERSLVAGRYRLQVCGSTSVRDLPGNPLDGDGDGTGGDDFRLDFSVEATNLLRNPNLDLSLSSWQVVAPPELAPVWGAADADGLSPSGSVRFDGVVAQPDTVLLFGQCVSIPATTDYDFGARVRATGDAGGWPEVRGVAEVFDGPECSGNRLQVLSHGLITGPAEEWTDLASPSLETPAETQSIRFSVSAEIGPSTEIAIDLDSLFLRISASLVFEDGFESGDTSRWAGTVP